MDRFVKMEREEAILIVVDVQDLLMKQMDQEGEETFNGQLNPLARKQAILTGIETHVCVLQTANDLIQKGYEVHVVADAICSRRKLDWEIGLRWMEKRGAMISTTEIIAFQLLKEAGTEEFRELSKLVK